ncbi:hypothetical protein RhiirC2_782937 [Rhizophagus irregularis]|uniref:Uncharacterized protein n=1 Tax=Rhizophagus irregularis TaxID=588596 RepID=A0A2N1N1X5_9GLOM|nr:hypothetical protein RhiirC2_782937 [Rhizophagus irregularis]
MTGQSQEPLVQLHPSRRKEFLVFIGHTKSKSSICIRWPLLNMTAVLRTNKYLQFFVPEDLEGINDYFKEMEASNWKLKHYLNYHLENDDIILA